MHWKPFPSLWLVANEKRDVSQPLHSQRTSVESIECSHTIQKQLYSALCVVYSVATENKGVYVWHYRRDLFLEDLMAEISEPQLLTGPQPDDIIEEPTRYI